MNGLFIEPRYRDSALIDVMPSIAAQLAGKTGTIRLPVARSYVVLLVDGLGIHQLRSYADHAETMASVLTSSQTLTCSVPSTTATSLTSLGCGVPPGEHGVVGYSFLEPSVGNIINALTWANGPDDVAAFRQSDTCFETLAIAGHTSGAVTLDRFSHSALTQIAFQGTTMFPVHNEGDLDEFADLVCQAAQQSSVVYAYERMLDHDGHGYGVGSWQWLERLASVDDLIDHLTKILPPDVCLLVTGDHGMINVAQSSRFTIEDFGQLAACDHIGGEPRFRHIYGADARSLEQAWRKVVGERALVLRGEEAIAAGWFGPQVTHRSQARIGDVVVAMREDFAAMSLSTPGEFSLVGMHGSLTAAEMEVPLLCFGGEY